MCDHPTRGDQIKILCLPIGLIRAGERLMVKMYKQQKRNDRKRRGKWKIFMLLCKKVWHRY